MGAFPRKTKHVVPDSEFLRRPAHFDVIDCAPSPTWMLVLFGGSGITRQVYESRATSMIDVFDDALANCALPVRFVFITAPFDLPFATMVEGDEPAERWVEHVDLEILGALDELPTLVAGFSGGARLAFTGVQHLSTVFAGGGLAADGLAADMDVRGLQAPPLFLYHSKDPVLERNRRVGQSLGRLVESGLGGHSADTYAPQLAELLRDGQRILDAM